MDSRELHVDGHSATLRKVEQSKSIADLYATVLTADMELQDFSKISGVTHLLLTETDNRDLDHQLVYVGQYTILDVRFVRVTFVCHDPVRRIANESK